MSTFTSVLIQFNFIYFSGRPQVHETNSSVTKHDK